VVLEILKYNAQVVLTTFDAYILFCFLLGALKSPSFAVLWERATSTVISNAKDKTEDFEWHDGE